MLPCEQQPPGGRIELESKSPHDSSENSEKPQISGIDNQRITATYSGGLTPSIPLKKLRREVESMSDAELLESAAPSAPVLVILKADLITLRQRPEVLPKSMLGKAIDYMLTLWDRLKVYQRISPPRPS